MAPRRSISSITTGYRGTSPVGRGQGNRITRPAIVAASSSRPILLIPVYCSGGSNCPGSFVTNRAESRRGCGPRLAVCHQPKENRKMCNIGERLEILNVEPLSLPAPLRRETEVPAEQPVTVEPRWKWPRKSRSNSKAHETFAATIEGEQP